MDTIAYAGPGTIPILADADVAVTGGGPGGLGAAVMAARAGARTLLVERYGCLGGMAVFGEVNPFMQSHVRGVSLDAPVYGEWIDRMKRYRLPAGEGDRYARTILKEGAALAMEELCLEAGVTLVYHHTLVDAVMDGRRIAAAVFHSKSGFGAIRARQYVDCTGDGDLAVRAGCAFEMGGPSGHCQPMTLCFKVAGVDFDRCADWKQVNALYAEAKARGEIDCPRENVLGFRWHEPGVLHLNTTRIIHRNATDGLELSAAELEARRQVRQFLAWLRAKAPGFEHAHLHSMAHHIGVRETRRIRGQAYLEREAFERAAKFDDAVARCRYTIDIHNPDGTGTEIVHMPPDEWYEIPYGCVVARDADNLTVGGRPISVDHAIHSSMRIMPTACSVGQAAGMGAAMAAARGCRPRDLDGREVRARLAGLGARLGPLD